MLYQLIFLKLKVFVDITFIVGYFVLCYIGN